MNNNRAESLRWRIITHTNKTAVRSRKVILWRIIMWTTPAATEMRFGFEVTMYVMNK
jgi:pyrroloquinoline quinone biosynthesis protein A